MKRESEHRFTDYESNKTVKCQWGEKKGLVILNLLTLEVHNLFWLGPQVQRAGFTHTAQARAHHSLLCILQVQDINQDEANCDRTDTPCVRLSQIRDADSCPVSGAAAAIAHP